MLLQSTVNPEERFTERYFIGIGDVLIDEKPISGITFAAESLLKKAQHMSCYGRRDLIPHRGGGAHQRRPREGGGHIVATIAAQSVCRS